MNKLIKTFALYGRKWLPFLFAFIAIIAVSSCEEIMNVSLDKNSEKTLVVEGTITTDTMEHSVILSYTGDYLNYTDKDMATGAEVTISDGSNSYLLHETIPGVYVTNPDVYGETGKTYTLHIKMPDNKEYEASDYLKSCTVIDSFTQSKNYDYFGMGYGYDVMLFANEPEPVGDAYIFQLYLDNVPYYDTINEVPFVDDEFVNGGYIYNMALCRIRESDISDSVQVKLEILSVSHSYYKFLYALHLETDWKGSPWDGPPANLPTNVSNGGLGYFRASDVHRKTRYFVPIPRTD
jgi:hypothetical protein